MKLFPLGYRPLERVQRDRAAWILERRGYALRRILAGGRWSIHDVVNDSVVRRAVAEQWRLHRMSELDRDVAATIASLERLETFESLL